MRLPLVRRAEVDRLRAELAEVRAECAAARAEFGAAVGRLEAVRVSLGDSWAASHGSVDRRVRATDAYIAAVTAHYDATLRRLADLLTDGRHGFSADDLRRVGLEELSSFASEGLPSFRERLEKGHADRVAS